MQLTIEKDPLYGGNALTSCIVEEHDELIRIPAGVEVIDRDAFHDRPSPQQSGSEPGPPLHVILPEGVREIRMSAFQGLARALTISLPDSLEKIEAFAFAESGLVSITLPVGLTSLAPMAFAHCKHLRYFWNFSALRHLSRFTLRSTETPALLGGFLPDECAPGGEPFQALPARNWFDYNIYMVYLVPCYLSCPERYALAERGIYESFLIREFLHEHDRSAALNRIKQMPVLDTAGQQQVLAFLDGDAELLAAMLDRQHRLNAPGPDTPLLNEP